MPRQFGGQTWHRGRILLQVRFVVEIIVVEGIEHRPGSEVTLSAVSDIAAVESPELGEERKGHAAPDDMDVGPTTKSVAPQRVGEFLYRCAGDQLKWSNAWRRTRRHRPDHGIASFP